VHPPGSRAVDSGRPAQRRCLRYRRRLRRYLPL